MNEVTVGFAQNMSESKVAEFTAFLSLTVEDSQLFETREGRVVVTRENIHVAGDGERHSLTLDTLVEFDFRTVPEQWEQFFDDLIGIRFEGPEGETRLTIGTESTVAVRFVTLVLKLVLTELQATVRQRRYPFDGEPESTEGEWSFTLFPQQECIRFEDGDAHPIAVSAVTGIDAPENGGIVVDHLSERGRLRTSVGLDTPRAGRLFRTYLEFRSDLADYAGPVRFVYVGEDRDTLRSIARRLEGRAFPFEAGHAATTESLFDALDAAQVECVVGGHGLAAGDLVADIEASEHDVPLVVLDDSDEGTTLASRDAVFDAVRVDTETGQYEDVADAIERAAVTTRL